MKPANAIMQMHCFFSFFFSRGEKQWSEIDVLLQAKLSVPDADFWSVHTPELSFQTLSHQILEQPEQKKKTDSFKQQQNWLMKTTSTCA